MDKLIFLNESNKIPCLKISCPFLIYIYIYIYIASRFRINHSCKKEDAER